MRDNELDVVSRLMKANPAYICMHPPTHNGIRLNVGLSYEEHAYGSLTSRMRSQGPSGPDKPSKITPEGAVNSQQSA
jgi:hypothetical protein